MDPCFITCDDIGKVLFCHILETFEAFFGHFNPLLILLISQQMWHPSSGNLSDFQMLLQKIMICLSFRAISRTVNVATPSMISFTLETISIGDADFGLPDFGTFLMDSTPDSNFCFHRQTVSYDTQVGA